MKHKNYPIICLCGSTRFKKEYEKINEYYTLRNFIVLSCGFFKDSKIEITKEHKKDLDKLHLGKIRMSDCIFVINKNGYIGESTEKEIKYADKLKKEILYLEPLNEK